MQKYRTQRLIYLYTAHDYMNFCRLIKFYMHSDTNNVTRVNIHIACHDDFIALLAASFTLREGPCVHVADLRFTTHELTYFYGSHWETGGPHIDTNINEDK